MNKTTYLKDYSASHFKLCSVELVFELGEEKTLVHSVLQIEKNTSKSFALHGEHLSLKSVQVDGRLLENSEYDLDDKTLILLETPEQFRLAITVEIKPQENTALSGLYRSQNLFCTQCESEGFRRITYFPDRPDVLTKYTTTIFANKENYPILLSNGNCIERVQETDSIHWVKWEDPFLKPCYLFALVAGNLEILRDHFVTMSGRKVQLEIYADKHNIDRCQHAMNALKKAMRWDEETYGCEYDLDNYMIVAVDDFNSGAMENKGLNIFNAKYILADPKTATDADYAYIDAVVGHEYFHNWSGNRVTCRDWFQLSLKEGLTVFREHQFSADIAKSPVSLIDNVSYLRTHQFSEDSGPMAHPVRPDSYEAISNFYTMTVYEKGAELIRMIKNILGWELFRKGMDYYFSTFDGQAVTTDDFVSAMEKVSDKDLTQFKLWYSQAGTPEITVVESYNAKTKEYELQLEQFCPATPQQTTKENFYVPILIGLLDRDGNNLFAENKLIILQDKTQKFSWQKIDEKPVLSFLREFSAPVKVHFERSDEELLHLLKFDTDDFSRWDSGQTLTLRLIFRLVQAKKSNQPLEIEESWLKAHRDILEDPKLDPAFKAKLLTLPALNYLVELKGGQDLDALHAARSFLLKTLSRHLKEDWLGVYQKNCDWVDYEYSPGSASRRRLRDLCLYYTLLEGEHIDLALMQWKKSKSMTDSMGVLAALIDYDCAEREQILTEFYNRWKDNSLVLDKWFRIQASSGSDNTVRRVKELTNHAAFNINNPNRVYSLIGAFSNNIVAFHATNGEGYHLLADVVLKLDPLNPQVAARMLKGFSNWRSFNMDRQEKMKLQLERIAEIKTLSNDTREVVSKCLVVVDAS